jgi:hypothetical protein
MGKRNRRRDLGARRNSSEIMIVRHEAQQRVKGRWNVRSAGVEESRAVVLPRCTVPRHG